MALRAETLLSPRFFLPWRSASPGQSASMTRRLFCQIRRKVGLTGPLGGAFVYGGLVLGACQPAVGPPSASVPQAPMEAAAPQQRKKVPAEDHSDRTARVAASESQMAPPSTALIYPRSAKAWLGVEMRASPRGEAGVQLRSIFPGSPAARAGLQPEDVLVSLNGQAALSPDQVADWVEAQAVNTAVAVGVRRRGQERLLRVELEGAPVFEDRVRLALVGRRAPEIEGVLTFQGEPATLAELRGKVVLLEFWASFCGVCRYLSPQLERMQRVYRPQGVEVIGITVDPPAVGAEVAAQMAVSYTLASDGEGRVTRSYYASQVPLLVLIDQKGHVRDLMVGLSAPRMKQLEEQMLALLKDPPG